MLVDWSNSSCVPIMVRVVGGSGPGRSPGWHGVAGVADVWVGLLVYVAGFLFFNCCWMA